MATRKQPVKRRAKSSRSKKRVVKKPVQKAVPVGEETSPREGLTSENKASIVFIAVFVLVCIIILLAIPLYKHWRAEKFHEENTYNGFEFTPVAEGTLTLWQTTVDVYGKLYAIAFYHHPKELEDIIIDRNVVEKIVNPESRPPLLYVTLAPDAGATVVVAGVEVSKVTGYQFGYLNIETRSALQGETDSNVDYEVVTCADASPEEAVLSFEKGVNNIVYQDAENEWCFHFSYRTPEDAIKVADRLSYALIGVMQASYGNA